VGKPLSIFEQARLLRARFPGDKVWTDRSAKDRVLIAELRLRPAAWCSSYIVRVGYAYGISPYVLVVDPEPVKFKHGEVTPHLNENGTLCLYDPDGDEWGPDRSIADTTASWASLWLLYYEDWLITGDWKGGGPPMPDEVVRRITKAHLETGS
jgi:hypothetical protein